MISGPSGSYSCVGTVMHHLLRKVYDLVQLLIYRRESDDKKNANVECAHAAIMVCSVLDKRKVWHEHHWAVYEFVMQQNVLDPPCAPSFPDCNML